MPLDPTHVELTKYELKRLQTHRGKILTELNVVFLSIEARFDISKKRFVGSLKLDRIGNYEPSCLSEFSWEKDVLLLEPVSDNSSEEQPASGSVDPDEPTESVADSQ